ncbi:MAG: squalene--hopene cyclase [Verrucomicrobia bacterium]|nr:squalene--hopene cyclase [Verrucomicrobiota bacterium]
MSDEISNAEIARCHRAARAALLAERNAEGFWPGELSTSALSTATAVCALASVSKNSALIHNGLRYLAEHQNSDGGWGDTPKSRSNISTTMLTRAAFHIAGAADEYRRCLDRANDHVQRAGGIAAVRARYGKDKTFAVPILMTCALAGLADWSEVDALPFELACVPTRFFAALRLPVVSYALPALIAIGQARFAKRPPRNLLARAMRSASVEKSLRVLEAIQPSSGGFLEATPLTSFVTMALAACGRAEHPVARKAVEFLMNSVRPDGSWPIDSNLSCWLTTLTVNALDGDLAATTPGSAGILPAERERAASDAADGRSGISCASLSHSAGRMPALPRTITRDWILSCQFREVHPYTNAAPGGWGWTHLPGSVPDADDTAGALLALSRLPLNDASRDAAQRGVRWLLDLQNSDGGWPTFCRGWTNLPFDRSGADLTAHVIRALAAWRRPVAAVSDRRSSAGQDPAVRDRRYSEAVDHAIAAGFGYLAREQRADGSWLPLWFGNEHVAGDENPVYGTARVLLAYEALGLNDDAAARRGRAWLLAAQNDNDGWGGAKGAPSSVEETALAVSALCGCSDGKTAVRRGLHWLAAQLEAGALGEPSPIGFYFAKLWYFEKLYPLIFTAEAFRLAAAGEATNKTDARKPMTG